MINEDQYNDETENVSDNETEDESVDESDDDGIQEDELEYKELKRENGIIISDLSEYYQTDKDAILEIIKKKPNQINEVSTDVKGYDDIVKMALSLDGMLLKHLKMYQTEYEFCKIAVKQNGLAIKHCSEKLRENLKIAKKAVKNSCYSYEFIGKELKNNRYIAIIALEKNINTIKWIGSDLKKTKSFIDDIIETKGFNLKYTSKKIRTIERCKKAILSNINNYKYACNAVKNDKNIIDSVLERNIKMFQFVPGNIRNDKEFVLKWLKKCKGYNILKHVSDNTIKDLRVFKEVYKYLDSDLYRIKPFIKIHDIEKKDSTELVMSNPYSYNIFGDNIKKDVDIINIFILNCRDADYISRSIQYYGICLSMYQICKILKNCKDFPLHNSHFKDTILNTFIQHKILYQEKLFYYIYSKAFLKRFEYYLGNEIDFPNSCFDIDIIYDRNKMKNHFTDGNDSKKQKFI